MQLMRYLNQMVSDRTDGTVAGLSRMIVGAAALLQAFDSAHILSRVLDETKLQIPVNTWLPVISIDHLPPFLLIWCVTAIAFTIGWWTRAAGIALSVVLAYSIVLDEQAYSNHVYLLTLIVVLLTLADCGNRFSIDALLGRRRETTPQWPITLLKVQLSIVYFFAAIAKMNLLYISGAIMAANMRDGWVLPLPESWVRWEIAMPLAMLSILTEVFLALAFWSKRYRYSAVCIGILLHTAIVLTFPMRDGAPLIVFGMVMLAMYVPFVEADAAVEKARRISSYGRAFIAGLFARPANRDTPPG